MSMNKYIYSPTMKSVPHRGFINIDQT